MSYLHVMSVHVCLIPVGVPTRTSDILELDSQTAVKVALKGLGNKLRELLVPLAASWPPLQHITRFLGGGGGGVSKTRFFCGALASLELRDWSACFSRVLGFKRRVSLSPSSILKL